MLVWVTARFYDSHSGVQQAMIGSAFTDDEIAIAIILLVFIDVVNRMFRRKWPTESFFCNHDVLSKVRPVISHSWVIRHVQFNISTCD